MTQQMVPPPLPGAPVAEQPQPQVVYLKQLTNGLATAALVLGIIGAVVGLIPLTSPVALVLGVLATVFGAIGRNKAAKNPEVPNKGRATAGLVLGIVSIVLSIIGMVIVSNAVNDTEKELNRIFECTAESIETGVDAC